jgi:hypothetical protein
MKSNSNQEFMNFLFDPFKVFHFKVRKNNLQITTRIILNKGTYIFVMDFFKDDHEINICDYTDHELEVLSKTYKTHVEGLVREPFKNSIHLFLLRHLSLKKSKTQTFFSRKIITSSQFPNNSDFSKFIVTNINLNGNLINTINNATLNERYLMKYFHLVNVYLIEYTYLEKINFLTKFVIFLVKILRLVIPMISSIVGISVLAIGIYNHNNLYNESLVFVISILLSVAFYYILDRFSNRIFLNIFLRFF